MNKDNITIKILGGLGNQMFQYSALLYYCEKYNKQPVIDMFFTYIARFSNQGQFEISNFNIDKNIKLLSRRYVSCFVISKFTGYGFYFLHGLYRKIIRMMKKVYSNYAGNKKPRVSKEIKYLQGYFVNAKYPVAMRDKIIKDFVPKDSLSKTVEEYLQQINKQKISISLHCRRGDYIGLDGCEQYGKEYYKKALEKLKSKGIKGKIYIFSDDIKWCEENLSDLGDVVFVKGTKSAFEDMWIMSKCKHNIITNSTFSWWGAFLNQNKSKVVIMPQKWNNGGDSADTLKFESCIIC